MDEEQAKDWFERWSTAETEGDRIKIEKEALPVPDKTVLRYLQEERYGLPR
jgi:hypothetical protein